MKSERIEFLCGDWSGDGHGRTTVINILITHDDSAEIITRLSIDEEKIETELNLIISNWFADYVDNKLPKEDVIILDQLNINYNKQNIDSDGNLIIDSVEEYFEIWIQLIKLVDPHISIEKCNDKIFCSNCTCYGVY